MKIIYNCKLLKRAEGLTLWPFILLKHDEEFYRGNSIVDHEKIHAKQQLELLILPFYILYLFNWIFGALKFKDLSRGYQEIIFEREAYQNMYFPGYLKERKPYAYIKYLRKNY